MKRSFLRGLMVCSVVLLFLASWCGASDNARVEGKSFLWKVQAKTGFVYLLGSVHLAKADDYPLPRQIEDAFDNTGTLALEADPGTMLSEDAQQRMVRSAIYQGSDTIRQHLSKGTYDLAAQEMKRIGISIEQFEKTKPWFLAMTIDVLEMQLLGYSPEYGFDLYFAKKAEGKKKIVELESFDYQINLLNGFTDREQELFLLYTIKDLATTREETDEMMRAWRTGDTKAMEKIVAKAVTDYPETRPIYDKLIYQRNKVMTGRIEEFLKTGESCLVVVGAAHLVGKEGILELLRHKGYRVEQM
jgi:uncharacterized protein